MKIGLAAGVAVAVAIAIAIASGSVAVAESAPVGRACQEVSGGVNASVLSSSYQSGGVRLDKQRGASSCVSSATGMSCLLNDPGRVVVSSGGVSKTYKAPFLAKVRITADGDTIACRVVGA